MSHTWNISLTRKKEVPCTLLWVNAVGIPIDSHLVDSDGAMHLAWAMVPKYFYSFYQTLGICGLSFRCSALKYCI